MRVPMANNQLIGGIGPRGFLLLDAGAGINQVSRSSS
jgi:hypothetical protein